MNFTNLFFELYKEKYGSRIAPEIAHDLVKDMAVTDNSGRISGEKWSIEESAAMAEKVGADLTRIDRCEWYLILNMMYSDYFATINKHALPETTYGELALDWFNDVDGEEDKTFRYFIHL